MEELKKVLEGRPVLYLATVEGYLPRVRPINHYMVWNGRFYIAMGKHKEAYKQLLDNTNLELTAALGENDWVRIRGTVNFDTSAEAYAALCRDARFEGELQRGHRQAPGPHLSGPHQRHGL